MACFGTVLQLHRICNARIAQLYDQMCKRARNNRSIDIPDAQKVKTSVPLTAFHSNPLFFHTVLLRGRAMGKEGQASMGGTGQRQDPAAFSFSPPLARPPEEDRRTVPKTLPPPLNCALPSPPSTKLSAERSIHATQITLSVSHATVKEDTCLLRLLGRCLSLWSCNGQGSWQRLRRHG